MMHTSKGSVVAVALGLSLLAGAATASVSGERVPIYNGYWFAWAAFHPKTAIWSAAATTTKDTAKSQD